MADIKYIISADASGAIKSIQSVRAEVQEAGKEAEKSEPLFSKLWKQVAGGVTVAYAVTRGVQALTSAFKSAIAGAMEAEKVDRSLLAALELTGRGSEEAAAQFRKFASALQSQTTYSDEAIKSAITLLAQLTKLDEAGLQKATKAAIGLASTLGMDLQSAAMLVAKAMEGNVGALSRYGFRIDETLPKNEALNKLLDQMAGLFERARAEIETTAGAWQQLKNAFSDWLEAQGKVIIKSPVVKAALQEMKNHVRDLNLEIELSSEKFSDFRVIVDDTEKFLAQWANMAAGTADVMALNWGMGTRLQQKYKDLGNDLNKLVEFVLNAGPAWEKERQAFLKLNPLILQKGQALKTVAVELENSTTKTAKYVSVLQELPKATAAGMEGLLQRAAKAFSSITLEVTPLDYISYSIENIVQKLANMEPQIIKVGAAIQGPWISAWEKLKLAAQKRIDSILNSAAMLTGQLSSLFGILSRNEEIRIENEYKKRLEAIEKNISDEEKRNQAIMALEAEYEIKRTEAKRKAAKEAKLVNIFQAIIDTAAAIVKTTKEWGMPFAIPWIAATAAIGAAQVAAIAAQPIPLAGGAIFERPTKMLSETGRSYLVGEAGTEILLPESKLRQIVRSEIGQSQLEIHVPVNLVFGTQVIQREVIRAVNTAGRQGLLKLDPVFVGV